jgi:hypothetical protein
MIQQTKTNTNLEHPNVTQPNLTLTVPSRNFAHGAPNAMGAPKQCLLILKGALSPHPKHWVPFDQYGNYLLNHQ